MESENHDSGVSTSADKSLFDVREFRFRDAAREDVFTRRAVITKHLENRLHSLTHRNCRGLPVLSLLNQKPAGSHLPNFSLNHTRQAHLTKINIITLEPGCAKASRNRRLSQNEETTLFKVGLVGRREHARAIAEVALLTGTLTVTKVREWLQRGVRTPKEAVPNPIAQIADHLAEIFRRRGKLCRISSWLNAPLKI